MRLRNIPGAEEYLYSHERYFVKDPTQVKGKWGELFGNDNPIYAEFGTGRGKFITTLAEMNPNINYIAVELNGEALYKCMKKVEKKHLTNLKMMLFNVDKMEEAFENAELDRIYLNFVDPWPKYRHRKRRLTHRRFIERYAKVLKDGGELHFKTDNRGLFEFSLNEFAEIGVKMKNIRLDLVADTEFENVTTEYEEKFMKKGNPIFRVEVTPKVG